MHEESGSIPEIPRTRHEPASGLIPPAAKGSPASANSDGPWLVAALLQPQVRSRL
jgi:hypothetical protein